MKKLFVALSLFFVLIPSYSKGWRLLEKYETASSFYQLMQSDQDSQYLKVWHWMIFRDKIEMPDGTCFDNSKLFFEVDCKNHRARILHGVFYNEAELVNQSPANEDWQPGIPDDPYDSLIRAVCKNLLNDFFKPVEVDIKRELSSLRGNEDQSAIKESLAKGKWFLASTKKFKMDEDNRVGISFFDKASLRINKQYCQILNWVLFTNPSSVNPLVIKNNEGFLKEYDCDKQRFRILKNFMLNKTGQIIAHSLVSEWLPANRDPSYDWVCENENKFTATPVSVDFRTIKMIPEEWLVGIDE